MDNFSLKFSGANIDCAMVVDSWIDNEAEQA